jgi:uncharacterized protein
MIIELESITRDARPVSAKFGPGEIDLDIEGTKITGDVEFSGETQSIDGKAHVRGKLAGAVEIECARCLEPVARPLAVEFDDAFVEAANEPAADEVEADDLDESIAIDGRIDLNEVVREQIILALPEQAFCREDCKGLCVKCGGNLNLINCSCTDDEIDPRWAALKNLN